MKLQANCPGLKNSHITKYGSFGGSPTHPPIPSGINNFGCVLLSWSVFPKTWKVKILKGSKSRPAIDQELCQSTAKGLTDEPEDKLPKGLSISLDARISTVQVRLLPVISCDHDDLVTKPSHLNNPLPAAVLSKHPDGQVASTLGGICISHYSYKWSTVSTEATVKHKSVNLINISRHKNCPFVYREATRKNYCPTTNHK